MNLHDRSISVLVWMINLFNPPPLQAMSLLQKIGRILFFSTTLVVLCILLSMLAAAGVFALEHARKMLGDFPELLGDLGIIFISMLVNTICVMVLLAVRRADHKLVPPTEHPVHPIEK